jgi:hypothetical protein
MALVGTTINLTATTSGWNVAITAGDGSGSANVTVSYDGAVDLLRTIMSDDQRGAGMLASVREEISEGQSPQQF